VKSNYGSHSIARSGDLDFDKGQAGRNNSQVRAPKAVEKAIEKRIVDLLMLMVIMGGAGIFLIYSWLRASP
jgi:hypothetical protein